MKRRLTIMLAVIGMLASAGIAAAAEDDPDDAVFNSFWDSDNSVVGWGLHPTEGLYDCTVEVDGKLSATYGITQDGLVVVEELHDDEDLAVMFTPTPEDELAEEFEGQAATDPVEYPGPDEECLANWYVVEGPNGQVNHGMIMSLFNSMYDGPHKGCVVRYMAQSDYGKKDNGQIKVSDVELDTEPLQDGDIGELDFESVLADCEHGNANKEDKLTGQENAAAKKAAKADRPRGNSADAPGKNKNGEEG